MLQQAAEQDGIDFAPEPHFAIDLNHWHASVKLIKKFGVGIDIDNRRVEPVIGESRQGVVAEVTTCSRIKNYVHRVIRLSKSLI
jgi:hypothetical protein